MKKVRVLVAGGLFLLGGHLFVSCASDTKYYCPMECEGDKTYEKKGSCPVCGMDLIEFTGEAHGEEHHHH